MRSKTEALADLERLMDAEGELEAARTNYLRRAGWRHTSSVPGCFWHWTKVLPDGRHAAVSEVLAIGIQRQIDGELLDGEPDNA